jgi:citrate lyase beta subunit
MTSVKDAKLVRSDAAHGSKHGFVGKLLIRPAQVEPAMAGVRPSETDVA